MVYIYTYIYLYILIYIIYIIYISRNFLKALILGGGGYNITYGGGSDDNLSLLGESFKLVHKIKAFQIFKVSTSIDIHTSSWFFSG